jgi:2-methylcitrate dehydratase PrpD
MITARSAQFIVEARADEIPPEALELARLAIMDQIGVAIAGSLEEVGKIITETVKKMGGKAESGIIGKGFKSSSYLAALANGTMGHAIDYDDVSFYWYEGHPSACLVPAALSIGESIGASGRDIMAAYVIGFEVAASINSLLNLSHRKQGWHVTGTIGSIGAVSVAARLLKLNVKQARMALGIAASLAGGLNQNTGTMTKPLHAGRAASNGVLAAFLAMQDFTASENIIEAPQGYARVFGCQEDIDWNKAGEHLGKKYIIPTPAIEFKRYPSCGATTGFIDAALALKREHNPDPALVAEIVLKDCASSTTNYRFPETGLEAEFSKEYCVCRALFDGKVGVEHFTGQKIKQPEVMRLMKLTKLLPDFYPPPAGGRQRTLSPQSVTVKLRDNTEYFCESKIYNGRRGEPMTTAELEQKYQDCASMVLPSKSAAKSLELLKNLESLHSIQELMNIVSNA